MTALHPGRARRRHTIAPEAVRMTRTFEIRVRGVLPEHAAERLGLTATPGRADTVLRGALADRPALLGVLDRLRCNGLELIDVRRLPDAPEVIPGGGNAITPRRSTMR
jgi:hypothetical protein